MLLDERSQRDLLLLILQFLEEEGYEKSLHSLERESKVFFNVNHFVKAIGNGHLAEAEEYLSAFTGPNDNCYSRKLFFELYKLKYDEAIERRAYSQAKDILWKDLSKISTSPDDSYAEVAEILSSKDVRENGQPHCGIHVACRRASLLDDLKALVECNPCLKNKIVLPHINKSALLSLIFLLFPDEDVAKRSLKESLIWLVLQFLDEKRYKQTLRKLEQETKLFFNMRYFVAMTVMGHSDKAEAYLVSFTELNDNRYSREMFHDLRKLKCLNALGRKNLEEYYMFARAGLHTAISRLAAKNPMLRDKFRKPTMKKSRLATLMKQATDWWVSHNCDSSILPNMPKAPYLCESPSANNKSSGRKSMKNTRGSWQISGPSECHSLVLPDSSLAERVGRLSYSRSGELILGLAENGTHNLWTLQTDAKLQQKINAKLQAELYQPPSGRAMTNEMGNHGQDNSSCFALKASYLFSSSGGRISVFNLENFERLAAFGSPSPTATYFTFLPQNVFAIGLDDGSILIYCLSSRKVKAKLEGHKKKVTCLAFSQSLNLLLSAGADAQLCVWSPNGWEKLASECSKCRHSTVFPNPPVVNHIQFDKHQINLLVVCERWIDIYEAPELNHLIQMIPEASDIPITFATYSCDSKSIYVSLASGCIEVLDAKTMETKCRINLSAYAQPTDRSGLYPVVIAAHPSEPNQIALGLSNGRVQILMPLNPKVGWDTPC